MWVGDHSRYLSLHSSVDRERRGIRRPHGRDRKGGVNKRKPARLRTTSVSFSRETGMQSQNKSFSVVEPLMTNGLTWRSNLSIPSLTSRPMFSTLFHFTPDTSTTPPTLVTSCATVVSGALSSSSSVSSESTVTNLSKSVSSLMSVPPPTSLDPSSTVTSCKC